MKKFKSVLSFAMSVLMLFSWRYIPAVAAEGIYPESAHNYENNYYNEWLYTYDGYAPYGLTVTFSQNTFTDSGDNWDFFINLRDYLEDYTADELWELFYNRRTGDMIAVFDGNDNLIGTYQGGELAGKTLYVKTDKVKITLTTDGEETAYGFKVDDISPVTENDLVFLNLHLPDGTVQTMHTLHHFGYSEDEWDSYYECESDIEKWLGYYENAIFGNEAVIGWTRTENGENSVFIPNENHGVYHYHMFESDRCIGLPYFEQGTVYDLYAQTTPIGLSADEVYSFTNSSYYFDVDGSDTYYLTKEDYCRLVASACAAAGVGPLGLAAVAATPILASYNKWNWQGSCIGFANTVCLQKKGILDVVGRQKGATCLGDIEPSEEIISMLNYYNAQSVTSLLCKNKALLTSPREYSRQLKNVCDSLEAGNIVLFEILPYIDLTEPDSVMLLYHGFVLTGIYDAPYGGHIVLYYDENSSSYSRGKCHSFYVPENYSRIYGLDSECNFFWTDEFECYKGVDINNDYPISGSFFYNIELLKHIVNFFIDVFKHYILRIG